MIEELLKREIKTDSEGFPSSEEELIRMLLQEEVLRLRDEIKDLHFKYSDIQRDLVLKQKDDYIMTLEETLKQTKTKSRSALGEKKK